MEKKLLAYGFEKDGNKYKVIKELADKHKIEFFDIEEDMIDQKVGYLMGLEGYKKTEEKDDDNEKRDIEFLLFSDFDRKDLTDFLLELRNEGIVVPHKSIITEVTKDWKFKHLVSHIEVEHRVMEKFAKLGTYVKKAKERLKEERDAELQMAVDSAEELTKMNELTEKDVDERYKMFMKFENEKYKL